MKQNAKTLRLFLLLLPFTLGFRVFPGGNKWLISKTDTTIWIRSCSKPIFTSARFPAVDPLAYSSVPDYDSALQTILDDYNSIPGSYLRLARYPDDPANPSAPADGETLFTIETASERTIDVCFDNQVITSGHALPDWSADGRITGCTIKLSRAITSKAREFVSVLTHEIGHCLGLDHPQETDDAIMSYFSNAIRLQIDDKMGIIALYPIEDRLGKESPSFGLSCEPR